MTIVETALTDHSARPWIGTDPEIVAADRLRDESACVLRHERTAVRPLLP